MEDKPDKDLTVKIAIIIHIEGYRSVFLLSFPLFLASAIGLAICKRIIERYGGRIWAESEHGKGSRFYFTMPVKSERPDDQDTQNQLILRKP